jgi:hypothetical protein
LQDLAEHAREVTDFLIQKVGLTKIEADEMWSFIKKHKNVNPADDRTDEYGIAGFT